MVQLGEGCAGVQGLGVDLMSGVSALKPLGHLGRGVLESERTMNPSENPFL